MVDDLSASLGVRAPDPALTDTECSAEGSDSGLLRARRPEGPRDLLVHARSAGLKTAVVLGVAAVAAVTYGRTLLRPAARARSGYESDGVSKAWSMDQLHWLSAAQQYSKLTAYWDVGRCGPEGDDYMIERCGGHVQRPNCTQAITVDESVCSSGSAHLVSVDYGVQEGDVIHIADCAFVYFAQYSCVTSTTTAASTTLGSSSTVTVSTTSTTMTLTTTTITTTSDPIKVMKRLQKEEQKLIHKTERMNKRVDGESCKHIVHHDGACLDSNQHCQDRDVHMWQCVRDKDLGAGNQHWVYDHKTGHIMNHDGFCMTAPRASHSKVHMRMCDPSGDDPHQMWQIDQGTGHIKHHGRCLHAPHPDKNGSHVFLDHLCTLQSDRWAFHSANCSADNVAPCNACGPTFVPPPRGALSTSTNGARLSETCFFNDGPHVVFLIGDWGGVIDKGNGKLAPADNARKGGFAVRPFVFGVDDTAQWRVAGAMKSRAPTRNPDYVLSVGDNFYWGGIDVHCGQYNYVSTGQFEGAWINVYNGPGLDGKQWLGVLGNHDYGGYKFTGGWDQQIAYTWVNNRWMLPGQYWSTRVNYPGFSIDYFFVDTNVHDAGPQAVDPAHNMCNGVHNPPGSNCGATGPADAGSCGGWFLQLWTANQQWLEEQLSKSTSTWQVIVTHFPPTWSQLYWAELSRKHGIDLIVAGHVHFQQFHYREPNDPLTDTAWIISGGGGGITSEAAPTVDGQDEEYGYFELEWTSKVIHVLEFSHGGQQRLEGFVYPRERAE